MPVANDDAYTLDSNTVLNIPAPGVLGNDTHLNLGGPGIQLQAWKVADPAHGSVDLNTNGSFTYTANTGFSGTDAFRYKVLDGRLDSVRVATVSIQVVGQATRLLWAAQPGLATNGWPFAQQPVLTTADESGNPCTNGLPATLEVAIALSAGTGPLLGTTNVNIGSAGSNGLVQFADLRIDSTGTNKVLTAAVASSTNLLLNGNFNAPNSGAAPLNWITWIYNGGWANHENKAGISRDGSYYMVNGGFNSAGGGEYQIVPATAGRTYTLSVQSGADAWWLPYGEMRLAFLDATASPLAAHVHSTVDPAVYGQNYDIPHPWSNYTMTAIAPAGTAQIKVEFAEPNGTGSVWFEDAVLTEAFGPSVFAPAATLPFTVYPPAPPASQTNYIAGITDTGNGTYRLQLVGTVGVQYCLQTTTNLAAPIAWEPLPGSTNTVTNLNGIWLFTITTTGSQQFYRSAVVEP
jgi:hypothetical protein